jgi:K+-transporting ATPase ATPase C chain
MKNILIAIKLLIVLTILTGAIYPALITLTAQLAFNRQANGDPSLIGQKFDQPGYFWPRPSAVDYGTLPSGGSNLSATSKKLQESVAQRKAAWLAADPTKHDRQIPSDLIYASGSGIDPEISLAAAIFQAERVARERKLDKDLILGLIKTALTGRELMVLGQKRVNVLKLNQLVESVAIKGVK